MDEKVLAMFEAHIEAGKKLLNADARELLAAARMSFRLERACLMKDREIAKLRYALVKSDEYRNSARLLRGALRGEYDTAQALRLTEYVEEEVVSPCST